MAFISLKIENATRQVEYIHGEHECDTFDFFQNYPNKQEIDSQPQLGGRDGISFEWFEMVLTSEDVETIKSQTWFKNASWDNKNLDKELCEGAKLHVVIFDAPKPLNY